MMSNSFYKISKKVTNEFLESISFIDDEATFSNKTEDHKLNAQEVTKLFASHNKVCSVYKVVSKEDFEGVVAISKKSDVTVLDWRIILQSSEEEEDDDESDDEDDVRGKFATDVIKRLFQEEQLKLKLIVIYTAENDFDRIISEIIAALGKLGIVANQDGYNIAYKNYRISLFGKATLKGRRLPKEKEERLLEYSELHDAIIDEFTKISSGLLLNVALKAISVLRENTFRILNSFDHRLDSAFLAHKALLPNPEDAAEQIIDIIGSDIKSLIKGNHTSELLADDITSQYIVSKIQSPIEFKISDKEKFEQVEIPETINHENLKIIVQKGANKFFLKRSDPFEEQQLFEMNCFKSLTNCFEIDDDLANRSNISYAKLTTLKTFYNDDYLPILTQGTILCEDYGAKNYWLCIQPKCDSVRITTKKRAFLLLRLIKVDGTKSFDIVLDEETCLKIDYSIFKSQLVDFNSSINGAIELIKEHGVKKYVRGDNKKMIWSGELKSDYGQYISNKYAADLARVGVDHSEWLRRS